jgi:glycosyltransferase involved in cell wall biosynthesis
LEAETLAHDLGVAEQVVFTGYVDYAHVPEHVAAGDIAIMPATNTYGNPMKVYEYMALGKAVLAPNQETITEIATHERDIYTFEPENIESIAGALTAVIEDGALRGQLGAQAVRTIANEHTWSERGKTLLGAMECVI